MRTLGATDRIACRKQNKSLQASEGLFGRVSLLYLGKGLYGFGGLRWVSC